MFIVSPIFLNYSASSWNPKQRILQLMLCPSPSGPSWRFFSALECCSYAGHGHPFSCLRKAPVICPGRPQSCHAPTVEYAPLKMVAVPSWWRFRNDQEKRWCRKLKLISCFPLPCVSFIDIFRVHTKRCNKRSDSSAFLRIFRSLVPFTNPTKYGTKHSGSYTFRSGCWTHKQLNSSDSTKQNMKLSDIPPMILLIDLPGIS